MSIEEFVAGTFFSVLLLFLLLICGFVFWICMLVDLSVRKDLKDKGVWALVLIAGNWLGAIVYFFASDRKKGRQPVYRQQPPKPLPPIPLTPSANETPEDPDAKYKPKE